MNRMIPQLVFRLSIKPAISIDLIYLFIQFGNGAILIEVVINGIRPFANLLEDVVIRIVSDNIGIARRQLLGAQIIRR